METLQRSILARHARSCRAADRPVEWGTAYAACQITSPREQKVYCRVGSNDSVKVFLNGGAVWDNPIHSGRTLTMDDDIFPITLPKGESTLLVKVSNMGGNWGFCLRITDGAGNAIQGLEKSLNSLSRFREHRTPPPPYGRRLQAEGDVPRITQPYLDSLSRFREHCTPPPPSGRRLQAEGTFPRSRNPISAFTIRSHFTMWTRTPASVGHDRQKTAK